MATPQCFCLKTVKLLDLLALPCHNKYKMTKTVSGSDDRHG